MEKMNIFTDTDTIISTEKIELAFRNYMKIRNIGESWMFSDNLKNYTTTLDGLAVKAIIKYLDYHNYILKDEQYDKLAEIGSSLYYMFKKYIDLGIEDLYSKYLKLSKSENVFIDTYGEGKYEGLVTKQGFFFSLFRDGGYQLSGDINGNVDCGSSDGMKLICNLESLDKDLIYRIVEYYVNLAINFAFDKEDFTPGDRAMLHNFIEKQTKYFSETCSDIKIDRYKSLEFSDKVFLDKEGKLKIEAQNNSIVVTWRDFKEDKITIINNNTLSRLVYQGITKYYKDIRQTLSVLINASKLELAGDEPYARIMDCRIFNEYEIMNEVCSHLACANCIEIDNY